MRKTFKLFAFCFLLAFFASVAFGQKKKIQVEIVCGESLTVCKVFDTELQKIKDVDFRFVENFQRLEKVASLEILTADLKERGAAVADSYTVSVSAFEFVRCKNEKAFPAHLMHKLVVFDVRDLKKEIAALVADLDKKVFEQFRTRIRFGDA